MESQIFEVESWEGRGLNEDTVMVTGSNMATALIKINHKNSKWSQNLVQFPCFLFIAQQSGRKCLFFPSSDDQPHFFLLTSVSITRPLFLFSPLVGFS